jgi:conjugal transfer mating pair stabilization protein TraN
VISKYYIPIILLLIANNILAATCSNPKTECVEAGGTKMIDGVSVTLDCWKYRTTYECREPSDNNCQQLRDQGCSQISATCRALWNGTCSVQDEILSCPVERCDEAGDVVCGKKPFCVGSGCVVPTPTQNNNFDKTVAALAALEAAAGEVQEKQTRNPDEIFIFAGRPMECSWVALGAKNCCRNKGWAKGVFMDCDDEERNLAIAREEGRAVEAGNGNNEYCHNKPLGLACSSHHSVYCVFDNKIARIVQQDGRKQLGLNFGDVGDDYAHPDCRGISINELKRLDFSKMDFSSLYDEIGKKAKEKAPTNEKLKQEATKYTHEQLKEKNKINNFIPMPEVELKTADRLRDFYDRVQK